MTCQYTDIYSLLNMKHIYIYTRTRTEDEDFKEHVWSLTEYEKDELKPGEIYCLECSKKPCAITCLECWDSYCKDCFKYTHASGNLKYHKTQNYHKAKKGWSCVKSKSFGESDYYINGSTGTTTYDKPLELMSVDEKLYFDNFQTHKIKAESFVDDIARLQVSLTLNLSTFKP